MPEKNAALPSASRMEAICREWAQAADRLADVFISYDPCLPDTGYGAELDAAAISFAEVYSTLSVAMEKYRGKSGGEHLIEKVMDYVAEEKKKLEAARAAGGNAIALHAAQAVRECQQSLPALEVIAGVIVGEKAFFAEHKLRGCAAIIGARPERLREAVKTFKSKFVTNALQ